MTKKLSMTEAARQFADAMGAAYDQTSIITQCVNACDAHFQGEEPSKADEREFADAVAVHREWSEASMAARKSEVRKIVRHYRRLPSAIKAVESDPRTEAFSWHDGRKVASILQKNANATDKQVVAAFYESKASKAKATPKTPTDILTDAVKAIAAVTTNGKKQKVFIAAVLKAADTAGIEYDVSH